MDVRGVLARGEKRGDGVQVGGKRDDGIAEGEEEIIAIGRGVLAFEPGVVFRGQSREMREQIVGHGFFVAGGGVNVHERAS